MEIVFADHMPVSVESDDVKATYDLHEPKRFLIEVLDRNAVGFLVEEFSIPKTAPFHRLAGVLPIGFAHEYFNAGAIHAEADHAVIGAKSLDFGDLEIKHRDDYKKSDPDCHGCRESEPTFQMFCAGDGFVAAHGSGSGGHRQPSAGPVTR